MRNLFKKLAPPIAYDALRRIKNRPKAYHPVWNTFSYDPMRGVKMFFDPHGPWQKKLLNNEYDSFLFNEIKSLRPEGKVICDIGAHIGFHTFYFAKLVGPSGKVYAFEPHPKNLKRLSLALDANPEIKPRISFFPVALSDSSGKEIFSMNEDIEGGRSSGGFLDTADTIWSREAFKIREFFEAEVETMKFDDAVERLMNGRKPDILKIDVEGAESAVLRGASESIRKYRPVIFVEIHSMGNMLSVASFLTSNSYSMDIINKEPDGRCFIKARPQ